MQRLPVESSDIVSIGYDPKSRTLEIEFKENRVYQYFDVAPDIYERFMRADSYGEYFFAFINRQYRYARVDGGEAKTPAADTITFVTSNKRKLDDLIYVCEPFGIEVEGLDLPVDEIQSHDPEEIAVKKAKQAYKLAGKPVVVNDAYWHIMALHGFPGAYMKHIDMWLSPEDLLALMVNKSDRSVSCTDTLVYYDGKRPKVFSQIFWGNIIDQPRGKGLSMEQIVVMQGNTHTIAEANNAGRRSIDPRETSWHDFAKWYNMHRRIAAMPKKGQA